VEREFLSVVELEKSLQIIENKSHPPKKRLLPWRSLFRHDFVAKLHI